jgi:hypothetical protein
MPSARVLAYVRQQLADRPENNLADLVVEACVAFIECDVARDVAFGTEPIAELVQAP